MDEEQGRSLINRPPNHEPWNKQDRRAPKDCGNVERKVVLLTCDFEGGKISICRVSLAS
jgi:hypothetical protein